MSASKMKIDSNTLPQWLRVLVSSQGVLPRVISEALKARYAERSERITRARVDVPQVERQLEQSAEVLEKKRAARDKARAAYMQADGEYNAQRTTHLGLDSKLRKLHGAAERELRSLADPRIYLLERWITWHADAAVRDALQTYPVIRRNAVGFMRTEYETNAPAVNKALEVLEGMRAQLHELAASDYQAEAIEELLRQRLADAISCAGAVLSPQRLETLIESAPDLKTIPPEALLHA